MVLVERLADLLDCENGRLLKSNAEQIAEIRLRNERSMQIVLLEGRQQFGEKVSACRFEKILSMLMDDSLYSRENELRHGYFTTSQGCRVGVCGKTVTLDGGIENFSNVGSLCIRLPREATGCATEVAKAVLEPRLKSLLIVSPPRLGKTTMLRDLARILSDAGCNIAIADERREIAACVNGIPTMNVGQRSDVMDGCAKAISIPLLIRSCAPDVLIADEIGTQADAEALLDAARCGVKIIASAHGDGYREIARRRNIAPLLEGHAFDLWALLGPTAGKLKHLGKCEDMGC